MQSGYKYKSLAKRSLGGSKINTYLQNSVLWSAFYILEYSFTLNVPFLLFGCWIFSILSGCKTVWIQIRPDICRAWSGYKLFAKVISAQQKLALAGKDLNTKQLVDTTFWLNPWLKLISFGSYFSIWLKCWLQQILSQGKPCLFWRSCHLIAQKLKN